MRINTCLLVVLIISSWMQYDAKTQEVVPVLFNYQGRVMDASGDPLEDEEHSFEVRMYDDLTGGSVIWGPQTFNVQTLGGMFHLAIGPEDTEGRTLSDVIQNNSVFLEIKVDGEVKGSRQRIVSVPFALLSQHAATATTAESATNAENATNAQNAVSSQTATNAVNAENAQSAVVAARAEGLMGSDGEVYDWGILFENGTPASQKLIAEVTAVNAENAINAQTAMTATNATNAENAQTAVSAQSATNAVNAENAQSAVVANRTVGLMGSDGEVYDWGILFENGTPASQKLIAAVTAVNAENAINAQTAMTATNATNAETASQADIATQALGLRAADDAVYDWGAVFEMADPSQKKIRTDLQLFSEQDTILLELLFDVEFRALIGGMMKRQLEIEAWPPTGDEDFSEYQQSLQKLKNLVGSDWETDDYQILKLREGDSLVEAWFDSLMVVEWPIIELDKMMRYQEDIEAFANYLGEDQWGESKYDQLRTRVDNIFWQVSGDYDLVLADNVNTIRMKYVPSGSFKMGDVVDVLFSESFYLSELEVTEEQWYAIMDTPQDIGEITKLPKVEISWEDCKEFCDKLNQKYALFLNSIGYIYDVPSEEQWEYACKAGTTTKYWWGEHDTLLETYAWVGEVQLGGLKAPNPWGFYDILGNVREWCNSNYTANLSSGSVTNPAGDATSEDEFRINRGGGYLDPAVSLDPHFRPGNAPTENTRSDIGFRLSLRPASW